MASPGPLLAEQSFHAQKPDSCSEALHRFWGYESFRPGQENIVRSISAGRDACVIMPTGGGKSLCYQLPAVLDSQRTAIVVSPLIALMQDQVAQLDQMGVPAAFLNSTLSTDQRNLVLSRASQGHYRLLYLSPERIALDGTPAWLSRIPISFFAIDEAHCISEWGHDFRPEYRQLSRLRELFPDLPIAAFTASATQRVRHDILQQLRLRDPFKHIASFRRPNLSYIIRQCDSKSLDELLLRAVKQTSDGSVIVYAPTITRVGETVDFLEENGVAAIGYHGQMDSKARRENQEKWMVDEVRVMVGTMAFGLGINKAAVRSVIHLSLPKSVEQYYQEAGRAGRDALPACCFLFWQKKDTGLHAFFIGQILDRAEKDRAWQRYREVEKFVQSTDCRQLHICRHFGESPKWVSCGNCDACSAVPDWLKIARRSPKRKPTRDRHREFDYNSGPPSTPAQRFALSSGPATANSVATSLSSSEDFQLKEFLREWRRKTAREIGIGASSVMWDTTLDDLCRVKPRDLRELRRVSGFGEKKTRVFGQRVIAALLSFHQGQRASTEAKQTAVSPSKATIRLLAEGRTLEEIAEIRGRKLQTVIELVAKLIESGQAEYQPAWLPADRYHQIVTACRQLGTDLLKPIKDSLPPEIPYDHIRLVTAHLRAKFSS